jgi:hypothetical protein
LRAVSASRDVTINLCDAAHGIERPCGIVGRTAAQDLPSSIATVIDTLLGMLVLPRRLEVIGKFVSHQADACPR